MDHVLFVHVPKTGGMSVQAFIKQHDGPVAPAPVADFIKQTDWTKIDQYKYFFSHTPLYVRRILPQPLFVFTFLRDPVERAISAYNHILRAPAVETHKIIVADRLDLPAAMRHPRIAVWLNNVATRILGSEVDLRPVAGDVEALERVNTLVWETEADDFTFGRALDRLSRLDFVGFTERFEQDSRRLALLLRLPIGEIPRRNGRPHDYPWPMPLAVRSPDAEEAVRRHSGYDCRLYDEARKAFWSIEATLPGRGD